MPNKESQIRARDKYDAAKMTTVGCRISREKAEKFKSACRQLGTTQYAVLKEAVEYTIEKAEKNRPEV